MSDEKTTEPIEATAVQPAVHTPPAPVSTARTASVIALRGDQDEFDEKQLSTLQLLSPGLARAPRGHLAMFFHYCVRTGLDPFARQIYMIGRANKKAERDPNEPEQTWTIQTGIDGFRTVAHRAAAQAGEHISYEETVYYDAEGHALEVWLGKEPPAAVKVTVLRGSARFPFIARWAEFAPTFFDRKKQAYALAPMWQKMSAHMLRKCAEAGALRMAAPQDLSGVYVDEEMEQADAEVTAGAAEDATRRLRAAAGLNEAASDTGGNGDDAEEATPEPAADQPPASKSRAPRKRTRTAQSASRDNSEEVSASSAPEREKTAPRKRTTPTRSRPRTAS
ncbi:recombinase RecT [Streptomyces fractus]|uniref:recombinase RecT n=1 Tax=Streptomyces fractus TaxID=641806 RepID=UPI003CF1FC3B